MDERILRKISRRLTLDKDFIDQCKAYDDIAEMRWEMPTGLADKDWAVKFVSPMGHNAEKTATNIFDTYNPKWDVLPFGPENGDDAEEYELFLEWHMAKANLHGDVEPSREAMRHSLRYNRVCGNLDYLPYWLPKDRNKWTDEQKEIVSEAPFCIYMHSPACVRYEMGKYGLRWVASTTLVPAADVIDHWSIYESDSKAGKKIAAALKKVEALLDEDEEAKVVLVDYTDNKRRYVCCWMTQDSEVNLDIFDDKGKTGTEVIDVLDGENELGFINWVIASGSSDALFSVLHSGDLWVNSNRTETIKRSITYRRAVYPLFLKEGQGPPLETDYSGDVDVLEVPVGTKATQLMPPPLDPAFNELSGQDQSLMAQSVSIQNLSAVNPASNVQFATVQAWIQLALTDLEPYKRTDERFWAAIGKMAFRWLYKTDSVEIGYRSYDKGPQKKKGQKIMIDPKSFDPAKMFVTAKLLPNTPTDKTQLTNQALQLKQGGFPIPDEEAIERLGYGNPEALKARWQKEQIENKALANFFAMLDGQTQIMLQNAAMAMAQQQQMQQQPQQAPAPPIMPEGQAVNPAQGGMPPAMAAPEMTRTQIR